MTAKSLETQTPAGTHGTPGDAGTQPPASPNGVPPTPFLQGDLLKSCQEVLRLWLSWNAAYEKASEKCFGDPENPLAMEEFMDQMDRVRCQAIALSQELLDSLLPGGRDGFSASK